MRCNPSRFPVLYAACRVSLVMGAIALVGCGRQTPPAQAAKPTPDPREQALIERAVRERLAQEDRATEQSLVNAREAASQRRIGVQMFRDLEEQYRQRQAEAALPGQEPSPTPMTPAKEAQTVPAP